ncbi:hypothetical protein SAMN02910357_02559 [Succinivibrio dextrinosolvens]|uniref:hypothetical protein n=1 Tax=Succinivibrio dextrinosolvens TaxID=83771 RepID=UPI0008F10F60|nr:hypothetical protein [Succinivibrio dextrinosolvens]SFS91390.1 hypothetical protein SAMN02910357_02559 [Succinivibrio dextrinosolvens]
MAAYVFQGILGNEYYVFEPEYLAYVQAPPPCAYLFTRKTLAFALSVEEEKISPAMFSDQIELSPLELHLAIKVDDYIKYCGIQDALHGLDHEENKEIRKIAQNYVNKKTDFLDIQYEGCFRGYEIYIPRMSQGGKETISMLIAIHTNHSSIFTLDGESMDVVLDELNFNTVRKEILMQPTVGHTYDIIWVAKYQGKDVLRIVNENGTSEKVPRYMYVLYGTEWKLVLGDEISSLLKFLPTVEQQDQARAFVKKQGFQCACFVGVFEGLNVYNVHFMPPCYDFAIAGVLQQGDNIELFDENNEVHKKIFVQVQKLMKDSRYVKPDELEWDYKSHLKAHKLIHKFCSENQITIQAELGHWAGMLLELAYHTKEAKTENKNALNSDSKNEWMYLLVSEKKVIKCPDELIPQVQKEYEPISQDNEFKTLIVPNTDFKAPREETDADELINTEKLMNTKANVYEAENGCKTVLSYLSRNYSPKLTEKDALSLLDNITSFPYGQTKEEIAKDLAAVSLARNSFKKRYEGKVDSATLNSLAKRRFPYEGLFFDFKESDFE